MFPSKTRADVGMVQRVSEGHGKPPGGKTIGTRRRVSPCKEGDQPVPAKPTIPTSGNILPRFLLLHNHAYQLFSFPLTMCPSLLCCARSSLSTKCFPANCLLLNLLCCAVEFIISYSDFSNALCVSMYQLQAPYSLGL